MRVALTIPCLAASALIATGCGGSSASSTTSSHHARASSPPTKVYHLHLSGVAETPPGAPSGAGTAIVAWHGTSKVCWRFAHLRGFTGATFAHIHKGSKGRSGNVVVPLSTATKLHHKGCTRISPALTKAIWRDPAKYYVNIHSTQYPGGAVRAQL